jgi:hypothetical protein
MFSTVDCYLTNPEIWLALELYLYIWQCGSHPGELGSERRPKSTASDIFFSQTLVRLDGNRIVKYINTVPKLKYYGWRLIVLQNNSTASDIFSRSTTILALLYILQPIHKTRVRVGFLCHRIVKYINTVPKLKYYGWRLIVLQNNSWAIYYWDLWNCIYIFDNAVPIQAN